MTNLKTWAAAAAMLALTGAAQAAVVFQGRLADNTASATCTVSGQDKCTSFYLSDPNDSGLLGFTILNNWNIGTGIWSANAAAGSAQDLAADAGLAATGLDGWLLPTGDGRKAAGPLNQYLSIWNALGDSLVGLQGQFDGVQPEAYWSGTELSSNASLAWFFDTNFGNQSSFGENFSSYAVAVRPGDVAASVPEPQTLALVLLALGATVAAGRRRSR